MELSIARNDFVSILKRNIASPTSDLVDLFSPSNYTYKGTVANNQFQLSRKKRLLDADTNYASAKGTLTQDGSKLTINIDVNGFHPLVIPFMIFSGAFYLFFFVALLTGKIGLELSPWTVILFLIHATLIFGLPYLIMRKSVSAMRADIERDIIVMMRDRLQ
ncbi:MAG: hypothetical protein ABIS36_13415 [Chryseolinea sp.]